MSLRRQREPYFGGLYHWLNMPPMRHSDNEKLTLKDISDILGDMQHEANYRRAIPQQTELDLAYMDITKTSGALPSNKIHDIVVRRKKHE